MIFILPRCVFVSADWSNLTSNKITGEVAVRPKIVAMETDF